MSKWQQEIAALSAIASDCKLIEETKWGQPCFTLEGRNIVLAHGFKDYCALLFFKGALMQDPEGILVQQTDNVQAARQIRFTTLDEIVKKKAVLKRYIKEAIAVEQSGAKVEKKQTGDFPVAEEFQIRLDRSPALKSAFEALTPGRQRAYLLHFASAKQSQTRAARVEKCEARILAGQGLND